MLSAILLGISLGLLLSFGFGTVFFALIHDSLNFGHWVGIKIAMGVVIGDALLIFLSLYGTSFLPVIPHSEVYFRVFGAIMLLSIAFSQLFIKKNPSKESHPIFSSHLFSIVKGFLLNVANPVNFIAWVVVVASLSANHVEKLEKMAFFISSLITLFLCESFISVFATKIKHKLNAKIIQNIKYLSSAIFIIIALKMIWDMINLKDVLN